MQLETIFAVAMVAWLGLLAVKHGLARRAGATAWLPLTLLLWVPLCAAFYHFLPHWRLAPPHLRAMEAGLWLLLLGDACFSLVRISASAPLLWGMRLGLPLLLALVYFGPVFFAGSVTRCNVPVYGPAILWSDAAVAPRTWYFLEVPESEKMRGRAVYGDPHEGKSVFAPFTGRIEQVEPSGYLVMTSEKGDLTVRVGPLMTDMMFARQGGEVFANQALGLLAKTEGTPGVRIEIIKGGPLVFQDCLAGRYLARAHEAVPARRNQRVMSTSTSRFQFR